MSDIICIEQLFSDKKYVIHSLLRRLTSGPYFKHTVILIVKILQENDVVYMHALFLLSHPEAYNLSLSVSGKMKLLH